MSYLFAGLENCVEIIGLENIDTSNVSNMAHLFDGDTNIKELDLSNFTIGEIASSDDIVGMFNGCKVLERI